VLPIIRRDLLNLLINPALLLYNTLFPFLLIVVLGAINRDLYDSEVITAHDYYTVAILVFMALNISIIATNSFMERSVKRPNLRIGYAPVAEWKLYVSKVLATFLFCMGSILLVSAVVARIYGVGFGGAYFAFLALLAALAMLASTIGVAFCCLLRDEESANKILALVNLFLALLGGVFFHPRTIGETFAAASAFSPVRWVMQASMRAIHDNDYAMVLPAVVIMLALGGVFLLICRRTFRLEDYL